MAVVFERPMDALRIRFFYGLFQGIRSPSQVGILSGFFGMRSVGELVGITAAVAQLVGASGPYIAGVIFDVTGNYSLAFIIIMVLLVIGGTIAVTLKVPSGCLSSLRTK